MTTKATTTVSVYEQECHGRRHFRVMRDDGRLVMDCHQIDFESRDDANACIEGEFRRKKLGPVRVLFHELKDDWQHKLPVESIFNAE